MLDDDVLSENPDTWRSLEISTHTIAVHYINGEGAVRVAVCPMCGACVVDHGSHLLWHSANDK